jgi:hypothetical protein
MNLTFAERLLQTYGITEPEEIDIEAIAYDQGAEVRYRKLDSCEARIIGYGSRAVITIDSDAHPRRKRFSLGHELGHWIQDKSVIATRAPGAILDHIDFQPLPLKHKRMHLRRRSSCRATYLSHSLMRSRSHSLPLRLWQIGFKQA